jgi:hypothetical protein
MLAPKVFIMRATEEAPVKLPNCEVFRGFVVQVIVAGPEPWRVFFFDCLHPEPVQRYCEEIVYALLMEGGSAWRSN